MQIIENVKEVNPKNILMVKYWLANEGYVHERKVYNAIRFIADVGGVLEVFMVCFAIFLSPISKFGFIY